jgi:hypothetical protein
MDAKCSFIGLLLGIGLSYLQPAISRADILLAFRGEDDDKRIWITKMRPDFHWEGPHLATGGTDTRPSIIRMIGGSYMLVARGTDSDNNLYWQTSTDGYNWAYRQWVIGAKSAAGPGLFFLGSTLIASFCGVQDDWRIYAQSWNGSQGEWNNNSRVLDTSGSTEGPNAARDNAGRALLVYRGPTGRTFDDQRIFYVWGDSNVGFGQEGGVASGLTSAPPAVIAISNGTFLVAVKGADPTSDNIWWTLFHYGANPPYEDWRRIDGVGTTHGPALAQDNTGIYMVWKGSYGDHALYFSRFTGTGWVAPRSGTVQDVVDCTCGTSNGPGLAGNAPLRLPSGRGD